MKKSDVVDLIKYHVDKNDVAFKQKALEIADEFKAMGDIDIGSYINSLLATQGVFVPQEIHYSFKYLHQVSDLNKTVFKFTCKVSKGTYIRSLINDIATKLNTIGTMKNLIRIEQGNFNIKNSYTLEDIKNNNYKIIPIKEALKDYFTVKVDDKLKFKVMNGQILDNIYNQEYVLFIDVDVIGLYKKEGNKLKPYKMFI